MNATNLSTCANIDAYRHTAEDTMELVGNIPIVYLGRISPENGAAIYAKLEFLNPGRRHSTHLSAILWFCVSDRDAFGVVRRLATEEGVLGAKFLESPCRYSNFATL
jgi:cysteine synthase